MELYRETTIAEVKRYFDIRELVCAHTYNKWGENSWRFLSTEMLATLLVIRRDILQVPMYINDYKNGGKNTQRGLRCNICPLVSTKTAKNAIYLSQHIFGKAFDCVFSAKSGMTAQKARDLIKQNAELLPYNIRIEDGVSWLHVDVLQLETDNKITLFKA